MTVSFEVNQAAIRWGFSSGSSDPLPNSRFTLPRTGRTVLVYTGQGVQLRGIGGPSYTCWIFASTLRM